MPAVFLKKNILIPSSFKSYCKERERRGGRGRVELFRGDGNDFGIKYDGDGTARRVAGALRGRSPVIAALVGYFNSDRGGKGNGDRFPCSWTSLEELARRGERDDRRSGKLNFQRDKFYYTIKRLMKHKLENYHTPNVET